MQRREPDAYSRSGVSHQRKDAGLSGLVRHLTGTHGNNPRAVVAPLGAYYASVIIPHGSGSALAISTDSVGTKVLVAQRAGRHDTIGIDCVAMNVNDVICVGADPLAMVDYIGVNVVDAHVSEQLGKGLAEGARRAEVSIPGGELAQVGELVRGEGEVHYDLIGTCVGVVPVDRVNDGSGVADGDVVIGLGSTGLHSNGFSLARRVVFGDLGLDVDDLMPECGRTVAEELLEPTAIYVRECKQLVRDGVPVSAFVNVTGGSFTNLLRVRAEGVAFHLGTLPEIPPVFRVLQEAGRISDAEMHQVFNLGVGFAIVVPEAHEQAVLAAARGQGKAASRIGRVVADASKRVVVTRPGIDGSLVARSAKGAFEHESSMPRSDR